jgi:hypothetical protein
MSNIKHLPPPGIACGAQLQAYIVGLQPAGAPFTNWLRAALRDIGSEHAAFGKGVRTAQRMLETAPASELRSYITALQKANKASRSRVAAAANVSNAHPTGPGQPTPAPNARRLRRAAISAPSEVIPHRQPASPQRKISQPGRLSLPGMRAAK